MKQQTTNNKQQTYGKVKSVLLLNLLILLFSALLFQSCYSDFVPKHSDLSLIETRSSSNLSEEITHIESLEMCECDINVEIEFLPPPPLWPYSCAGATVTVTGSCDENPGCILKSLSIDANWTNETLVTFFDEAVLDGPKVPTPDPSIIGPNDETVVQVAIWNDNVFQFTVLGSPTTTGNLEEWSVCVTDAVWDCSGSECTALENYPICESFPVPCSR